MQNAGDRGDHCSYEQYLYFQNVVQTHRCQRQREIGNHAQAGERTEEQCIPPVRELPAQEPRERCPGALRGKQHEGRATDPRQRAREGFAQGGQALHVRAEVGCLPQQRTHGPERVGARGQAPELHVVSAEHGGQPGQPE